MSKKETLEEAIKRNYETRKFNSDFPFDPQSFKLGAKWQQEQQDCCTPAGQIKRYVDCIGCDRKPNQTSKQTAVEWFSDNVWKLKNQLENKEITLNQFCSAYFKLYEEAKEMEKEQIMEAYMSALPFNLDYSDYDKYSNKYYNETYKKDK